MIRSKRAKYNMHVLLCGPSKNHVYTNTVFVILSTLLLYCYKTTAKKMRIFQCVLCVCVRLSTTNSIIEIISGPSKWFRISVCLSIAHICVYIYNTHFVEIENKCVQIHCHKKKKIWICRTSEDDNPNKKGDETICLTCIVKLCATHQYIHI